jgi:hypothetical protein
LSRQIIETHTDKNRELVREVKAKHYDEVELLKTEHAAVAGFAKKAAKEMSARHSEVLEALRHEKAQVLHKQK